MTGQDRGPEEKQRPSSAHEDFLQLVGDDHVGEGRPLMGAYTGRLKAAKIPGTPAEKHWREKAKRRPSLKNLVLEEVPEATEYSDDDELSDPIEMIKLIKAFPEIDNHLKQALRPDPDDGLARAALDEDAEAPRFGRTRMEGRFDLLYIGWILTRDPAMQSFWRNWRSTGIWQECGFVERPDYQIMRIRFIEFEKLRRRGFREAAQRLIRNGKKHDPLIGLLLMLDETRFDSVSLLEHCCPDPKKCRELIQEQRRKMGASGKKWRGPRRYIRRATDETYNDAKATEVAGPELVEGEIPETVVPQLGIHGQHLYREKDGHFYRTADKTAGARKYEKARDEWWHGGLLQVAVDVRYRTAIDYQAFAADEQPYDHLPDMWENLEEALGQRPLGVSLDGLYATRDCSEFFIRRGTMPVKPHTRRESPTREDMRCDVYDEHQVIRCPTCGGETEHELAVIFQNEDPRVRVRCLTPNAEKCYGWQSVPCAERWGWVTTLNYTHKITNQLREKHGQMEGFFASQRARYRLAGKDTSGKVKRRAVVPAQQLRAEASLFVEWLRLSLRHGWIGSWKNRNTNKPVPVDDGGRLEKILKARRKRALRFPYGKMAVRLGLCKPPPDEDAAPVAPAPAS